MRSHSSPEFPLFLHRAGNKPQPNILNQPRSPSLAPQRGWAKQLNKTTSCPCKKFHKALEEGRESPSQQEQLRGWLMSPAWLQLSLTYFLSPRVAADIFTGHKRESLFCLLAIKISCGNDKLIRCCVKKINF